MTVKIYVRSLYPFLTLFLFLVVRTYSVSSSYDKGRTSKFVNDFVGYKKGDVVRKLDRIKEYLVKYGYLSPSTMGSYQPRYDIGEERFEVLDHYVEDGIKRFQLFNHLGVSGVLDEETLSMMAKPRCSFPDMVNGKVLKHGTKLALNSSTGSYYVIGHTKWPKLNLTWAIRPGTRADAYQPILSAFRRWGLVTKFRFIESNNFEKSDIKISFFKGQHGDNSPFDGPLGVLAHAWMPPDGRIHFDADEKWVIGAVPGGVDIESVVLHELGHALGLAHSNVKAAIMWRYTDIGAIKRLNADDVAGIKALYNLP